MLAVCGTGNILVTGASAAECCSALWDRNIQAVSVTSLRDAMLTPLGDVATVFCLDFLDQSYSEKMGSLPTQLYQTGARYVCIYAGLAPGDTASTAQCFEQLEYDFFVAGFRRHPRLFHALNYQSREYPPAQSLLFFERIPESAQTEYSLKRLHESRLLHMDMLRDSGRRSDAHLMRYFAASIYIRPGDTVLDCACGLGYGSHMLYNNSRARRVMGVDCDAYAVEYAKSNYAIHGVIDFEMADAQDLSGFTDNSFDFIAGFETIEHLPEPEKYLRELFRVLRPSGRIMISAPDMWVDETGKDPNPHHFHVYTWDKLYAEIATLFIPDKGFVQIAGGALKLPHGKRQWREIPCRPGLAEETEWLIMTAMKNPLLGHDVPYAETTFPDTVNPEYHVGAFSREYDNPWLLKSMVSIGYRLENEDALKYLQDSVIAEMPPDSVDYGAALCGKCYALLSGSAAVEKREHIFTLIEDYVALLPVNPHVTRWQVSLLFAAALLHRKYGEFEDAEALFMRCAAVDVLPYSPLLGNKTLDALYNAAIFALGRGDKETARRRLISAMEEAIRLVRGTWLNVILDVNTPFEPGFPEVAQLMDRASRCCYMLGELDTFDSRPGLACSRGKGWHQQITETLQAQVVDRQKYIETLQAHIADQQKYIEDILSYQQWRNWKITVPLRKIYKLFRALQNKVKSNTK